jgi:serine/threonine protein kinase
MHPPNIRYIQHYETETHIYIVMEYLNGDCLNAILAQNSVNESQLIGILLQILKGLKYIHEMGIIHRDIKMENIIFENDSNDSEIKIVDFGLSSLKGPYQDANECYGTLNYLAPEMLAHMPYDNAVDLWSLGIIMYSLIEKGFPFDGNNSKEVYK